MPREGAPKGNQYAKKEIPGRTIGLYITSEEYTKLVASLQTQGKSTTNKEIDQYARTLFKNAVTQLREKNGNM